MTGARTIFAIGLFGVPLILLWLGHALRKRTLRQRGAFWGGVTGYCTAVLLLCILTVVPPLHWSTGSMLRDLAVHWSMLLFAAVGAGLGALRAGNSAGGRNDARGELRQRTGVSN